jgi:hypothetical protein
LEDHVVGLGASVVGASVVPVGACVVGASVVGACVVGASVVGASVVGASVVGASVVVVSSLPPQATTKGTSINTTRISAKIFFTVKTSLIIFCARISLYTLY